MAITAYEFSLNTPVRNLPQEVIDTILNGVRGKKVTDHRLRHHEFLPFILGEGGDVPLISISVASFICLGAGPGRGYLIHGSHLPRTPGSGLRVSCCT
jgi:hypothetical protein